MEIKEYIESGVIELYVLGGLPEEEAREVERMASLFPEVEDEIRLTRESLARDFLDNPVTPPAHIKDNILKEISGNTAKKEAAPAPVVSMDTSRTEQKSSLKFYLAAASILLIISLGLNFYFFNQGSELKETQKELSLAQKDLNSYKENYTKIYDAYYSLEKKFSMAASPQQTMVKMAAVDGKSDDLAVVLWDTKTKMVYVSVENMEDLPKDKQYQLWAIVDGKPVDMGVFDPMKKYEMKEMKAINTASAFAVTVEKAGGVPSPTMESMVVMGNL